MKDGSQPRIGTYRRTGDVQVGQELASALGQDALFATVEEAVGAPPPVRVPALR